LGIDPGFGRLGWGVIEKMKGPGLPAGRQDWQAKAFGCLETSAKKTLSERLLEIHKEIRLLIKKYRPERVAVEELFFFQNVSTAIQVGQARGVVLLSAVEAGLPVDEYTPLEVKQAVAGYGRAEKKQVQKMVAVLLGLKGKVKSDDAADALAVALCAGARLAFNRRLGK